MLTGPLVHPVQLQTLQLKWLQVLLAVLLIAQLLVLQRVLLLVLLLVLLVVQWAVVFILKQQRLQQTPRQLETRLRVRQNQPQLL